MQRYKKQKQSQMHLEVDFYCPKKCLMVMKVTSDTLDKMGVFISLVISTDQFIVKADLFLLYLILNVIYFIPGKIQYKRSGRMWEWSM